MLDKTSLLEVSSIITPGVQNLGQKDTEKLPGATPSFFTQSTRKMEKGRIRRQINLT